MPGAAGPGPGRPRLSRGAGPGRPLRRMDNGPAVAQGGSLSVWSRRICFDRPGTFVVGAVRDVAPDLGGVVELPRKIFMSVPEHACVTAKRLAGWIAGRRVSSGRKTALIGPGLAMSQQGRPGNAPATISPRSCVVAARPRRYAPRQRPFLPDVPALRGLPAVLGHAVARAAVAGARSPRKPDSDRPCAKRLLVYPAWAEPGA